MKRLPRPRSSLLWALVLTLAGRLAALTPTEWEHRQSVEVAAPGLVKLAVPVVTFDAAQPDLADLRLISAAGQETPYLLERDDDPEGRPSIEKSRRIQPGSWQVEITADVTELTFATGLTGPVDAVTLETSAPFFLKAAHVETSRDGAVWQSLGAAAPLFRQFGAEQLQLPLGRQPAPFVRISIDDTRSRPILFTGVRIQPAPTRITPPFTPAVAQLERREEFAGETVLTVTLAGRQVPLSQLHLDVQDALFMRRVTITVRELQGGVAGERVIGDGTLYRVALDGSTPRAQLDVPVELPPPTREVLVHIHNGDSPPLAITAVEARLHPVNLFFSAPAAGSYALLSGNPQASTPHYDVAAFAGEMSLATATAVVPGALEPTPNYHPREALADGGLTDLAFAGVPLDTRAWSSHRVVQLTRTGVQELELDPAALAQARPDFSDLRLQREGNQLPYVLEQPDLARSVALSPTAVPESHRPTVSVWRVSLSQAGLPVQRVVLSSTTPLFQRHFRVYERQDSAGNGARDVELATGTWSRTPEPGTSTRRVFELNERPRTRELWIETDNGDNPPITLESVQVTYPVVRLIFKATAVDGLTLANGNPAAGAPRYDLNLVAAKLLTAGRSPATLAETAPIPVNSFSRLFAGLHGGPFFWGALAVVVIVLLVIVARLLPKPAE